MSLILISTVATATYFDLKSRRIPNWLTYGSTALSFLYFEKIFLAFIVIGIFAGILFNNLIGSGDIKLSVCVAIWSQILNISQYWIYFALLFAGIGALVGRQKSLPFAPYLALGLLSSYLARSYGFI
jgi:Flp pilus assembly protein protease CpaA